MKNIILLFSLFLSIQMTAQDVKILVETSGDSVLLGNYIEVRFTIENAKIKEFIAPQFEGFTIVGGPNQSSSFSMVNGDVTSSVSYSYYLEAKDIGNYYIDPASIDTGEEILETKPIEIIVLDNPDGIIQKPNMDRKEFRFFDREMMPSFPQKPKQKAKPKKKRKVYKI
ncbi:MAG TPA: hypothetical protein ENK52_07025 [Saprospiraceae bacterium]|nr:hypothetical protein [Saprospiraceae bacterium]